jgi:hypothetical protein
LRSRPKPFFALSTMEPRPRPPWRSAVAWPFAAPADAVAAYTQSVGKSGPLGELIAWVGARTATSDAALVDLYARLGWCLAARSQLLNDARDAAPGGSTSKSDVRGGAPTVPLVFAGSRGAPPDLSGVALERWEADERRRVASVGGMAAAIALAEAERLRANAALDALAQLGRPVQGLRALL